MAATAPPLACETRDADETLALGAAFAVAMHEADVGALVVDLRGDLGAGKTVFVQGLARGLGLPPGLRVVSPTFTIARAYPVTRGGRITELHHADAYRLGGPADLEAAGFEEMCGAGRVTCVEWGENVSEALPVDRVLIRLCALRPAESTPGEAPVCPRSVSFEAGGPRAAAVLAALGSRLRAQETMP